VGCKKISTLQHTATHCNSTLQRRSALQQDQHTAIHYITVACRNMWQCFNTWYETAASCRRSVCCSVVQYGEVCCMAVCCSVVRCADCVAALICNNKECVRGNDLTHVTRWQQVANAPCVAVWCFVLQCVAVCCMATIEYMVCECNKMRQGEIPRFQSQYVAVCCSVLQCVAVRCSALQLSNT